MRYFLIQLAELHDSPSQRIGDGVVEAGKSIAQGVPWKKTQVFLKVGVSTRARYKWGEMITPINGAL